MTICLYGISNCDTVRKARRWLEDAGVDFRFHDFRADGLSEDTVAAWIADKGWEAVLNRRSTSWKALSATQREQMTDSSAIACAIDTPTLIKRPVLDRNGNVEFGFTPARYQSLFTTEN